MPHGRNARRGRFGARRRETVFEALTDAEVTEAEGIVEEAFEEYVARYGAGDQIDRPTRRAKQQRAGIRSDDPTAETSDDTTFNNGSKAKLACSTLCLFRTPLLILVTLCCKIVLQDHWSQCTCLGEKSGLGFTDGPCLTDSGLVPGSSPGIRFNFLLSSRHLSNGRREKKIKPDTRASSAG